MSHKEKLFTYWKELYPQEPVSRLDEFLNDVNPDKTHDNTTDTSDWYKDAVVYALYVDLFNVDFNGLKEKLGYLQGMGVSCLWLLPILDSPMRDAGFDVRNYDRIRADLLGLQEGYDREMQERIFKNFLQEAHQKGIKVIFDIAINHCSDEHPLFQEAKKSEDNPYRDYFIWSKTNSRYSDARLLFKGIEDSNWELNGDGWYYFHRFFNFQPDWNYRNPDVLLMMSKNLLYWQRLGVDGFRADAIPYLWKEDESTCENLPKTHTIVKFFRAMLDHIKPGNLLLAEACQKPNEVVKYLGDNDECHAAYHFPLMPMMFKAIAAENVTPIKNILSPAITPEIPESAQWFTFLRVHDELSLELVYVSEEDRKFIHERYCHQPEWDFRLGEGISARLAELMQRDPARIALAYSLMLTLTGTPVVYYGDEFGKLNDETYYKEQIRLTGKDDTRFLVRGRIDWQKLEKELKDKNSFHNQVYRTISAMLDARRSVKAFGRGTTQFLDSGNSLLAYLRETPEEKVLVVNNLSSYENTLQHPYPDQNLVVLHAEGFQMDTTQEKMHFEPHGFAWFLVL